MPAKKSHSDKPAGTRILIVDDHALLRRGLASLIETEADLRVCAEADSRRSGLDAILASKPDLVIADLSLKDSDGLEMIKDIKRLHPYLPILVVSMHDEMTYAERALRAGAGGYVTKQEIDGTVIIAIRRLLAGEVHISDKLSRHFAKRFVVGESLGTREGVEMLSDRELEVFKMIGRGKTTREIALLLGLSVKTIESYREHLKLKLNQQSGVGLSHCAILWIESGRLS
jgi:DNA-binding NarL/FixJ family response regulator